jgi:hypothetical protein
VVGIASAFLAAADTHTEHKKESNDSNGKKEENLGVVFNFLLSAAAKMQGGSREIIMGARRAFKRIRGSLLG